MYDIATSEGAMRFIELMHEHCPEKLEELDALFPHRATQPVKWVQMWRSAVQVDDKERKWLMQLRDRCQNVPPSIVDTNTKGRTSSTEPLKEQHIITMEGFSMGAVDEASHNDPSFQINDLETDTRVYLERVIESDDVANTVAFGLEAQLEGESVPEPIPGAIKPIEHPDMNTALKAKGFTTTLQSLSDAWDNECVRIETVVRQDATRYFGEGYDVIGVGEPSQKESIIVGRLVNEDSNHPLTPHSLLLEGSRKYSRGGLVGLRLDKLNTDTKYYLYPGKIVVCLGVCLNEDSSTTTMRTFQVYRMMSGVAPLVQPPSRTLPVSFPDKLVDLCVLGGPFFPATTSTGESFSRFDFTRFKKACAKIRSIRPSLAVIMGPFIAVNHPLCIDGGSQSIWAHGKSYRHFAVSHKEIYTKCLHLIKSELCGHGIEVAVMPHAQDVLSVGPMPQKPLNECLDGWNDGTLLFTSNPCHLNMNGMGVVIVGQDLNADIAPRSVKGQAITTSKKKITQLANEMVEQSSLLCGVMRSSVGFLQDDRTVRCLAIGSGIQLDGFKDKVDPTVIIHTMSGKHRPQKFVPVASDRTIGSAFESLVHIRLNPTNDPDAPHLKDGLVEGRVQITSYLNGRT